MSDTDDDVFGPIDFLLIEFPGDKFTGEIAAEVSRLIETGTIRLYDVVIIRKDADGTFSGLALDSLDGEEVGGLTAFSGARSGLLGDDDVAEAAQAMEPGTVAVLFVYENAWAVPFVRASRRAGGQVIATERIPAQAVMDALDALESAG